MSNSKIFAYAIIVALIGVFAMATWLASQARFFEAISVVGVATTLAWFATRFMNRDDDDT